MNAGQFDTTLLNLMEIDSRDARLILAARSCLILRGARQVPLPRLGHYLLSCAVAKRFVALMDVVQQIWPKPFGIHQICYPNASMDEALLCRTVHLAMFNRRPAFDALFCELLACGSRHLLYSTARNLYARAD